MTKNRVVIWDLPLRLFHWSLAACVAALLITGELGGNLIEWHGKIGLAVVGLLAFRLVWGFAGSTYARFCQFFPTPARIQAYLRGEWHAEGHNPLGALSVFGMLGLLFLQVSTGLFANDDIAFFGPLYALAGPDWSERLTGWHHEFGDLITILIGLHLAAIVFHVRVKKHDLVKPMVRGWKEAGDMTAEPLRGGGVLALVVALLIAGAAVYGASGSWLPEPPAPAPASAPAPAW